MNYFAYGMVVLAIAVTTISVVIAFNSVFGIKPKSPVKEYDVLDPKNYVIDRNQPGTKQNFPTEVRLMISVLRTTTGDGGGKWFLVNPDGIQASHLTLPHAEALPTLKERLFDGTGETE